MGNCCSVEDDEVEDRARPDEILKDSMESHRSFLRHSFDNSHGRELRYSTASFCDALPGDQTQTTLIVFRRKTGRQPARTKFVCDTNGMEYCSVREDDASRLTLVDAQGNDIAVLMGGREKNDIAKPLNKPATMIPTRDIVTIYGFKPSFEGQQPSSAGLEGRELYEGAAPGEIPASRPTRTPLKSTSTSGSGEFKVGRAGFRSTRRSSSKAGIAAAAAPNPPGGGKPPTAVAQEVAQDVERVMRRGVEALESRV